MTLIVALEKRGVKFAVRQGQDGFTLDINWREDHLRDLWSDWIAENAVVVKSALLRREQYRRKQILEGYASYA